MLVGLVTSTDCKQDVLCVKDLSKGAKCSVVALTSFPKPSEQANNEHWEEWQNSFVEKFVETRQVRI
jgi:hypothetical protein